MTVYVTAPRDKYLQGSVGTAPRFLSVSFRRKRVVMFMTLEARSPTLLQAVKNTQ